MRDARLQYGIESLLRIIEPDEERFDFVIEPCSGRRFVMHALTAGGTGYDLHRAGSLGSPGADRDFPHPAARGPGQGCMPAVEPLGRKWRAIVFCRIEHHFDDALDMAIGRHEPPISTP